jgi:CheY-like chemotaxis protein
MKLFLVDDDAMTNLVNKKIINKYLDADIQSFTDPEKAIHLLEELSGSRPDMIPDVLFLDINMPLMDGWEFLKAFENLPEVVLNRCKVYMLSSSIDPLDVSRSRSFKAVHSFIEKPLTEAKLAVLQSNSMV